MLNIALDGPSGSGKSTVAGIIAKKLDILHLDTGAMYRACALAAQKRGISCRDEEKIASFIDDIDLEIRYENGVQKTFLDGEDVSLKIRNNEVSLMASDISSISCVRRKMVEMQQKVAASTPCILDGRDIGTVVLPSAPFKFFITASPSVRAERRCKELEAKGQHVALTDLLEEINRRDYNDSHRKISPLRCADDATMIDTSLMSAEEVADRILSVVTVGNK